jgi:hypothetical protein
MIALITPTGARKRQIELCARWMLAQDYKGEVLWIIIDDAEPVTVNCIPEEFREDWEVIKIYPEPKWKPGRNTQARNLLAGLEEVKNHTVDAIFIIEDDDYYKPEYLSVMVANLQGFDIAGETCTVYYNVAAYYWMQCKNRRHSSLFQTAFTSAMIPVFEKVCIERVRFIDMLLFQAIPMRRTNLFTGNKLSIGIKGLPGRAGIGMGHHPYGRMAPDTGFAKLKEFLGADYIHYVNHKNE